MSRQASDDAAAGCFLFIVLIWVVWVGFLIWGGITLINWITTK